MNLIMFMNHDAYSSSINIDIEVLTKGQWTLVDIGINIKGFFIKKFTYLDRGRTTITKVLMRA